MKRIIRSAIIFWGIVAIFPLIYIVYSLFLNSNIYANFFGVGDGEAYALAWLDENINGFHDINEPPLANVCVWFGYRPDSEIEDCGLEDYQVTDANGQWVEFLAGSECNEIYIFAAIPDGYQPITDLARKGCYAEFGFVQKNVKVAHRILTIDEFARREITKIWLQNVTVGLLIFVVAFWGTKWLEKV
jgi:hypothetical protein